MTNHLCLHRGYECNCEQCQPWKTRWDKELEAFSLIDTFIRDGKSLFHMYERLSAEHPDVLQTHYKFIEEQHIEHKQKPPPPATTQDSHQLKDLKETTTPTNTNSTNAQSTKFMLAPASNSITQSQLKN